MASKKEKRDRKAEQEKEMLLDPEGMKKKIREKRKRRLWLLAAGAAVFLLAVFGSYEAVKAVGKGSLKGKAQQKAPELKQAEETASEGEEGTSVEEEREWKEGWVRHKGKIYAYNEDILTFLIMGIDRKEEALAVEEGYEGGQADALFLLVFNPHDRRIRVVGINRNTMSDIDIYSREGAYITTVQAQIGAQHGFGDGVEKSCGYEEKAVSKLFYGLPIHGYAALNMGAVSTLNDAVGGVEVEVLEDLTQRDKSLKKGERVKLSGESAFWYVKYRDVKEFGSADRRLERQKQYLKEFIRKAEEEVRRDIGTVKELYQAVSPMLTTDISLSEALYLAGELKEYHFKEEDFYLIEGETVEGEEFEEFYADEEKLYELILEIFYEEVEEE